MKLDTYHRYAAFFDAARALPGYQWIRLSGDEPGHAYREWCAAHGLEVVEDTLTRFEGDRCIEWGTLESPGLSVGVHLDDRPRAMPEPAPAEPYTAPEQLPEQLPDQPIEQEIAF